MVTSFPTIKKLDSTQTFQVLFGVFDLSAYRVPFMSAVLSLRQISEWFSLVTDNPKYAKQDWTVEELFQREIDMERARAIANIYLASQSSRPQFFNSLTVVLIPTDSEEPPDLEGASQYKLNVGPIAISYSEKDKDGPYPAGGAIGTLRWNRNGVNAVAIDGQHRLAALKELNSSRPELANAAFVSVLFLILDKKFGFKQPNPQNTDYLASMRSLFTDLNKHAVSVSRARNLLLDDHDPSARFVRSLFSRHLKTVKDATSKNTYGNWVGTDGELREILPLNLIDWHGETKSKIDKGPYVASVLSLDWIVQRITGNRKLNSQSVPIIVSPDPGDDGDPYDTFAQTLERSWPSTWKDENLALSVRIEQAKKSEQAFHLNVIDVNSLAREFAGKWSRAVTRILIALPGYRAVVKERENTLTPEFGQWFQARESWQNASDLRIKEYYKQRLDSIVKELDQLGSVAASFRECVEKIEQIKSDNLLFSLVGQRAVFICLFSLCETQKGPTWFSPITKLHKKLVLKDFLGCWQDFFAFMIVEALWDLQSKSPDFLSRSRVVKVTQKRLRDLVASSIFWAGSLVKREDSSQVDFSGKAADRGSRVILVIVYLYWWLRVNEILDAKEAKKIIASMRTQEADLLAPFAAELATAIGSFVGKDEPEAMDYGSPMHFLTKQLSDWDQTLAEGAALARVNLLVDIFCKVL